MFDNTRNWMGSTTIADNAMRKTQRQSWNEDSILDDLKRNEAHKALLDVCGDEMILQDTLQVSLAEHKSQEEQEARENIELVNKHLASVEIEKMVEGTENVIDDSSIPKNDDQNIPDTRLEPRSNKESPKVEITNDEEVEITNVVIPINVNKQEEEITDEVYELKRRRKEDCRGSLGVHIPHIIRSPRIHTDLVSLDTEKLQELTVNDTTLTPLSSSLNTKLSTTNRLLSLFDAKPARLKCYKSFFRSYKDGYGYLFEHLRQRFLLRKLYLLLLLIISGSIGFESLPTLLDKPYQGSKVEQQVTELVKVQVRVYVAKRGAFGKVGWLGLDFQRDNFSNDTFRGLLLYLLLCIMKVKLLTYFRCGHFLGGVKIGIRAKVIWD
ncbi:hypothetical protein Tco_0007193 [Tanacetum coccineum]